MILVRSVLFNAAFFLVSAGFSAIGIPLLVAPRRWSLTWVRLWSWSVQALLRIICGTRLEVIGRENLPDGPAIFAAKHQSAFDTIVWLTLLEAPAYVMKKELFSVPVWGWLARRSGQIAVDRTGGAPALRGLVRAAKRRLAEGRSVVIFPEGTRSAPGARLPYYPGVVALAKLGVPVIPVATDSGLYWGRRSFLKQPGSIRISILPALDPQIGRRDILDCMTEVIETESDRLLASA